MYPVMWLAIVFLGLWLVSTVDRVFRARRRAEAISRQRWFEYSEMAARNAEQWRIR